MAEVAPLRLIDRPRGLNEKGSWNHRLEPATDELAGLVDGVRDEQLSNPTPCRETSLAGVLDRLAA